MTDDQLIAQFEARTLPCNLWTHRAHVRVAYTYLRRHPFDQALARLAANIQAYNAANNVPESPTSGYNQTTTHALLHLIAATMDAYGEAFPTPTADAFCDTHPQLMTRHCLRLFYSPQRRMHPDAKKIFIEPDLAPLPKLLLSALPPGRGTGDRVSIRGSMPPCPTTTTCSSSAAQEAPGSPRASASR